MLDNIEIFFNDLIQLVILYGVIFDPFTSLAVFSIATKDKNHHEQLRIGLLSVIVAAIVSFTVLLLGNSLLNLFDTTITDFRIAAGIILLVLGINMALGRSLTDEKAFEDNSGSAIASIIGTPLLAGPASITTIIVTTNDYGYLLTGLSLLVVLLFTGILFSQASKINKLLGKTTIQVMSSILGLVTLAWGVKFIRIGTGLF